MKTNFRLSSKMHLFVIISCVLIALGLAVGTICHFVANGFFNYGGDYGNYNSVTVNYESIDFSGGDKEPVEIIEEICNKAFADAGVSSFVFTSGNVNNGGEVVYKFSTAVDMDKLTAAANEINAQIKAAVADADGIRFSYASAHSAETLLGGGLSMSRAAIVIACIVVVHFIYFVIRFRLTIALGAVLADVHNFALFVALAALLRIPVGSSVATYAVLAVLITVICSSFYFDKLRKSFKDESLKKLSIEEISDKCANESIGFNLIAPSLAIVSVLLFVLLSISSLSPLAILSPVLLSLVGFIVCAYGSAVFTPSVYTGIKQLGDKVKTPKKQKNTK